METGAGTLTQKTPRRAQGAPASALALLSGARRAPRGPGCRDSGIGAGAAALALVAGHGAQTDAAAVRFPQAPLGTPSERTPAPGPGEGLCPGRLTGAGFQTSSSQPELHVEFFRAPRKDNTADPHPESRCQGARGPGTQGHGARTREPGSALPAQTPPPCPSGGPDGVSNLHESGKDRNGHFQVNTGSGATPPFPL